MLQLFGDNDLSTQDHYFPSLGSSFTHHRMTGRETVVTIAVVIPCYRVKSKVLSVIGGVGPEVDRIFVVDDGCPEGSGRFVKDNCHDPRVEVLFHDSNRGVGGAVKTGYRAALKAGAQIVVKIDGDGQMNPALLPRFTHPIATGRADYVKGNRFFSVYRVRAMPRLRLAGNAALSFLTKLSSGYWSIFDPTNGYTAIHRTALQRLELNNVADRYFFESDMLINLANISAVVRDVEMEAVYEDEQSNLRVRLVLFDFLGRHGRALVKRILYRYFLRDFNIASLQLLMGLLFLTFGVVFGLIVWTRALSSGIPSTPGTAMLIGLSIILGIQFFLGFVSLDIGSEPRIPLTENAQDE